MNIEVIPQKYRKYTGRRRQKVYCQKVVTLSIRLTGLLVEV